MTSSPFDSEFVPTPFSLQVPEDDVTDLRDRLARTRFPDQAPGEPWAHGTDLGFLRQLVEHWRTSFDWRAQEARLNAFAQYRVPVARHRPALHPRPGCRCRPAAPAPMPLLLSHGWPGSVFEFLDIIPRLTDPAPFRR